MMNVTVQVIEGLERGRTYEDLPCPLTIGREDDNTIRLNDERVSRFHAKLQEDGGRIILTDLDSTNGTRVNGHPVQMRVLQPGDQLTIGRCLLIYGSREEIEERALSLRIAEEVESEQDDSGEHTISAGAPGASLADRMHDLFPAGPPSPPVDLSPGQRAEVSDFLAYVHEQIRHILLTGSQTDSVDRVETDSLEIDWLSWQRLLRLEMDLARSLRAIAEPDCAEPDC
ncbi:MAG: FHA domain-containing protein [Planctomycetaceae bacterium]|nr:FHA domain-containing protein [Planctomycetaceae bacterium]